MKFLCFFPARGRAKGHPAFKDIIRKEVQFMDGYAMADSFAHDIIQSGDPAPVILPQNWGRGTADPNAPQWYAEKNHKTPLTGHSADGLDDETIPGWWLTPNHETGTEICRRHTLRFITRYRERQESENLPDPARILLDIERSNPPHLSGNLIPRVHGVLLDAGKLPYAARVTGHGTVARPQVFNPNESWAAQINSRWADESFFETSLAYMNAINKAFIDPMKAAFPGVEIAEYGMAPYDGVGGRFWTEDRNPLRRAKQPQIEGMVNPVLYHDSLDTIRHHIYAIRGSYDGNVDIVPWIATSGNDTESRTYAPPSELIPMLHAMGIEECILWCDPKPAERDETWDEIVDIIERIERVAA